MRSAKANVRVLALLGLVVSLQPVGAAQGPAARASAGQPAPGVKVSGKVEPVSAEIRMPTDAVISKAFGEAGRMGGFTRVPVLSDGSFEFGDVQPGRHRISLQGEFGWTDVTVGATNLTGVKLVAVGTTALTVAIRVDDGGPVPPRISFRAYVKPGLSTFGGISAERAIPIRVPPGSIPFFVSPPSGFYVASLKSGDVDLLRSPLEIAPASAPRTIDAVLTRTRPSAGPTSRFSGRVTGRHPGLELELVESTTGAPTSTLVRRVRTGPDGSFVFDGLPTGVYTINAPPAQRVVEDVVIMGPEVTQDIPIADGTLFAGGGIPVLDSAGQSTGFLPGRLSLVFSAPGVRSSLEITNAGFWGVLPPGAYDVSLEGLAPGLSAKSITAGSVDLLTRPFVVPDNRPAETIRIVLLYTEPTETRSTPR